MSKKRLMSHRSARREWLRRLDRLAADLNVLLVMFAIGLAVLDVTFLVSERLIDRLPVTRIAQTDMPPAPSSSATGRLDLP